MLNFKRVGKTIGSHIVSFREWLFPPPQIEFLTGERGMDPVIGDGLCSPVRFRFKEHLFVQQMFHEKSPGGVQHFEFDVWGKIPDSYYAILSPVSNSWSGGRLMNIPKYFPPGWSGEFTYTAFNAHPEDPTGLPVGQEGFELILSPIAGQTWLMDKK